MPDRVLALTGVHNFRDYGDYAVAGGGRLKRSVLFRSGQHVAATDDDLAQIAELDLTTVVDLRGNSERRRYPCARAAGFAGDVVFFDGETAGRGGAPHVAAARDVVTAADAHAAMVDLYAFMPFRPNLVAVLRDYFATLVQRDGAHLVHCLAGKDRTGLAVALLHELMGVHEDDLMADYMLTNSAGNAEARIAAGAASIRASRGPDVSEDAIRVLMAVHPQYLDAARAAIREVHGSVEAYLSDVLQVTPAMRTQLAARLLA